MKYRNLGRSGVKVSEISLGSWLTYGNSTDEKTAEEIIDRAYGLGINFFDTANVYAKGHAEEVMGKALSKYPRESYVLASKVWGPVGDGPNDKGLSRKHIFGQIDASLKRLGLDYLDVYYCHRFDLETPVYETMRAFDDLLRKGKVLYMGVSNWTAAQISEALLVSERYLLDRIIVSQPVYNLVNRKIEDELLPYCHANGISQAVYSPLAQGLLTGKYVKGAALPEDSRASDPKSNMFISRLLDEANLDKAGKLKIIAAQAGMSLPTLALAWILRQQGVASCITGASRPEQVEENAAASVVSLSDEILAQIETALS